MGAEECVTEPAGTLLGGPVHNQLPNPATAGRGTDNNSFWVPDFSPSHYNKLIYTKTGLTQRVRPDLTGPDGKPGVNLRGYTVKNHYREMSRAPTTSPARSPAGCRCRTPRPGTAPPSVASRCRTTAATRTTPGRSAS